MPATSETDHNLWHLRLQNWAKAMRGGYPDQMQCPSDDWDGDEFPYGSPDERDAERVEICMTALKRRWLMGGEALAHYYLSRLWRDEIAGYRELDRWLSKRYRGTWTHQSDGLDGESRAERLLHRAVEALDCY